ncbi:phenylalanine--tRNA ligase subunit beta [Desulfolutivibrio sulfoxidireducens]|uniref:phenylalanine--tRNA ligase subunit beta n=1 Tax=Desulfolutivibrio sulfoxidireducens TaxID=2773299 RepID=UPI00159EADCE|nr:phenylalanine--tRNA ligase subunit beta [Desulfolutivibrio sulfoxidireducens]QLA15072.1 phenylalanine--tRNA ligase subunit beta [Desulfolutivibrio sulfoxidireducens]
MLLSLAWLREFTPYDGTPQALADRLTMLGLEVEDIHDPFAGLSGVVVGQVLTRDPHPEADKLSLCTVDVGGPEALSIVCGAPNVAAGQHVPVAVIGATLPNGMTIKKSKIRGQLSCGMICSESELGLSEESAGIMVLAGQPVPGARLAEALGLDTCVLDVSITPNRADCLSVLGLARETAMAFGLPLTLPDAAYPETDPTPGDQSRAVAIEIADPALCPVYRGKRIKNLTVGKSPDWLRHRLVAVGQRPISNVVDVTNYVLFELGQPMHAFDRDILDGNVVRVAPARDGMRFTTLDGQERTLTDRDLLIWDAVKPVGLAGVMGGENSEMTERSTEVFLECAVFDPATIRKTARRLGIPSEASYRFERGVDQVGSKYALDRAVSLILRTAGGQALSGVALAEPRPWTAPRLAFRKARAEKLLGVPLADAFCRDTLAALGCVLGNEHDGGVDVLPPSHRLDLEREVDLVEEVGRVYGLDRIPPVLPAIARSLDKAGESPHAFWNRVRAWAVGVGLREAVNYSFVGHADLDLLCLDAACRVSVANPLTEEQNVMRPELAPGLLQTVRTNISRGNADLRLFEVAKVFHAAADSETGCRESSRLGLALHGGRHPEGWPFPVEQAGYEDIKGLVENLLAAFQLPPAGYALDGESPWLSPRVELTLAGRPFGYIGRVTPEVADAFHARRELWLAEVSLDLLAELAAATRVAFRTLPVYPPVRRDITVIAPAALSAKAIEDAILAGGSAILEDVFLADLFVPEGATERNLTYRLTYRHAARTLKDKEVDREREVLAGHLAKVLPVRFS